MDISERLKAVASMVKTDIIADIGTDHGYVPIYLLKNNIIKSAIACDINKGPLNKADINIRSYRLSDKIETRLGSGLIPISKGEVKTSVIAGMGGMLIIDILKSSMDVTESMEQLVLQPQLDIDKVRKYIHSIGFKIEDEKMVYEEGKFYNILSCVPGKEKYLNERDYIFGKILIDKKDKTLRDFIIDKIKRLEIIIKSVQNKNTENSRQRFQEASDQIRLCMEVLECF